MYKNLLAVAQHSLAWVSVGLLYTVVYCEIWTSRRYLLLHILNKKYK